LNEILSMTSARLSARVREKIQFFSLTRVKSALKEPLDLSGALSFNLLGLVFEDVDELSSDELALLLRVMLALEASKKFVASIDNSQVDAELLFKDFLDLLTLVETHAAVVHKNSVESVSNGLGHQLSGNSGVYTTADSTKHLTIGTNERTNPSNLLTDELCHCPLLFSTADTHGEVLEELPALRGVYRMLVLAIPPDEKMEDPRVTSGWN
jgi:hypothetical protein